MGRLTIGRPLSGVAVDLAHRPSSAVHRHAVARWTGHGGYSCVSTIVRRPSSKDNQQPTTKNEKLTTNHQQPPPQNLTLSPPIGSKRRCTRYRLVPSSMVSTMSSVYRASTKADKLCDARSSVPKIYAVRAPQVLK